MTRTRPGPDDPALAKRTRSPFAPTLYGLAVCCALAHALAIWVGMGAVDAFHGDWPVWRDDHPLYFHSALVTRRFLARNGTTAGYDPAFMSGYPKSVVFPSSSTLPELVVCLFGGARPERAYQWYVLVSAAAIPWLVGLGVRLWRGGAGATFTAVALFVLYVWTDFPINYAAFGMLPYLLAIPLGLVATGIFARYVECGGFGPWLASAVAMALVVLVHFTSAMIVAPASAAVYAAAVGSWRVKGTAVPRSRHVGVWLVPVIVLAANAFWWLPGVWLASTKGPSGFAFAHPEGVLARLWKIVTVEAAIERVLIVLGLVGFVPLFRRSTPAAVGLATFAASGFAWGYLAGGFRSLDFLQPGRHTFAFYTAMSVAAGVGLAWLLESVRRKSGRRLDVVVAVGLAASAAWFFYPIARRTVGLRLEGPYPFLTSKLPPRLQWIYARLERQVRPGERLLYEEGGFDVKGYPDPYSKCRFSGLIADRLGIELIGGPYLHASLTANFTQFGEGKLFGRVDWDRPWFEKYARLYRPSAIVCWTPRAREFCATNRDVVEVVADDGYVLIGRVKGFEGAAISGKAEVESGPGRLRVLRAEAGVDGTVVLRYHSVPCLRADPPVAWEPVYQEGDPVPFIKMRPPPGAVTFEMRFPPAPGTPGGATTGR